MGKLAIKFFILIESSIEATIQRLQAQGSSDNFDRRDETVQGYLISNEIRKNELETGMHC